MQRNAVTQVASGNYSALVGGKNNTTGGATSSVVGGEGNDNAGVRSSIVGGLSNAIDSTNPNSVILGGNGNQMTGLGGTNTIVSAKDSTCATGYYNFIVGRDGHSGGFSGCKVLADSSATPITAKANYEFAVQADNIRLDVGTPAVGDVLTCDHVDGSSQWAAGNGTVQGTGITTLNIVATDEGAFASTTVRGENSVDLQTNRSAVTQVAAGTDSVIIGGQNNEAAGNSSTILGGDGNVTSAFGSLAAGKNATASHNGARVFSDSSATAIASKAAQEFCVQADNIRLDVGTPAVGQVLTCNHVDGSSNWADPAAAPSVTGTASFTNSTNNISLTGIGDLGGTTEVGDVIQVSGSTGNNKLYTVSTRTDANNIIVNEEHAGLTAVTAEEGNKALATENTGTQTITLYSKAKTAPLGIGQGWVDTSASRAMTTTYTNSTGRSIWVNIRASGNGAQGLYVDNLIVSRGMESYDSTNAIIIQPDSEYYYTGGASFDLWTELR